jgi:hypothetical protein
MKNRLLIILLITLLNLTSGVEARGKRPGDVVEIGQGKSFKLVADKDRIWVMSPRSRPEGNQDLILYELDPVSLRPLWSSMKGDVKRKTSPNLADKDFS